MTLKFSPVSFLPGDRPVSVQTRLWRPNMYRVPRQHIRRCSLRLPTWVIPLWLLYSSGANCCLEFRTKKLQQKNISTLSSYDLPFLPPQHAGVMLKEPFQEFVTSRQESVCAGRVSPGLAVTRAVVDTVTPSLPVRYVPPATSPWTPRDRTSA